MHALSLSSEQARHRTLAYTIGQRMFTPDDISVDEEQPDDLPYAGLLYWVGDFSTRSAQHADLFRLTLGLVGPWSLAEQTHKFVHDLVDTQKPRGWAYLGNEVVINGLYERRHRLSAGSLGERINYEWVGIARGELGTLNTAAEVGLAVMLTEHPAPAFGALQPAQTTGNYLFRSEFRQRLVRLPGAHRPADPEKYLSRW